MARRAVRSSRFSRGPRRATDWSASGAQAAVTGVGASTATLLQSFTPIVGGETAIRIRGLIGVASDQQSATELQLGAVGIAVVTQQAQSVGITAIPHPDTDAAWGGWMWHSYFARKIFFTTGVGFQFDVMHQIPIDSKSMRKVDEDERLVVVVENSAAFGIDIYANIRILSKVH